MQGIQSLYMVHNGVYSHCTELGRVRKGSIAALL